jgi:flagellar L-ring protein precursor FlgH
MSRSLLSLAAALAACTGLSGCVTLAPPRVEMPETTPAWPTAVPVAAPVNGSIYQAAQYRPLFEDYRARMVGDLLNVSIVERVSAAQTSKSTIGKTGSVSGSISALPGISPGAFARAGVDGKSANTFDGKGATENTNDFSGTITATVIGVLPNGHLMIAGEKQIGVNSNVDVLRFTGQVDPRSIQPGNTVQSAQVANVRVEHRGRGAQADANAVGWLSRFFLSILPI